MTAETRPKPDGSSATRARILSAAQVLFSTKGYSHAGLREIAKLAEVAPSLVMKYFGTKARLFEAALVSAILPLEHFQADRSKLGQTIVDAIFASSEMNAPTMIALSLGDAESRKVASEVVLKQIIEPMAEWLAKGQSDTEAKARSQAANIFLMTTGFSLFARNMDLDFGEETQAHTARAFAHSLQAIVEASPANG